MQGVQEKLCFLHNHCNPFLAYINVRDLQSSQRNASVQSSLVSTLNQLINQFRESKNKMCIFELIYSNVAHPKLSYFLLHQHHDT